MHEEAITALTEILERIKVSEQQTISRLDALSAFDYEFERGRLDGIRVGIYAIKSKLEDLGNE